MFAPRIGSPTTAMPEPDTPTIAVVAAMSEEIGPLRKRLRSVDAGGRGRLSWTRGKLRGVDVVLAATGEGRRNAGEGLRRLIDRHRPGRVLAIGVGGALSPRLRVGDLLLAAEIFDGDEIVAAPDREWLERVRALDPCPTGRLVTVDEILTSPEAKARWRPAGGGDRPAIADLESAAYARVAAERRIPCLVARAVSDRADEALPSFLARCRRADGGIDRPRVLLLALARPRFWGRLARLWLRTRRCARRLADLAEAAIAAGA